MTIALCIPTIRRFDTLQTCVESALLGSMPPDKVIIIDNSAGRLKEQPFIPTWHAFGNITMIQAVRNLGCAASWNMFMGMAPNDDSEYMTLISNDDVTMEQDTIKTIWDAYIAHPEVVLFHGTGKNGYSLFATRKSAWSAVGGFDEKFYPAYYEDNDYSRAIVSRGYLFHCMDTLTYGHVGSATLATYTPEEQKQHHRQQQANQAYYIAKWGGLPHREVFQYPFNRPVA